MSEYVVIVSGCDASTEATVVLTDEQFATVQRLATAITSASTYGCEPTMGVLTLAEYEAE